MNSLLSTPPVFPHQLLDSNARLSPPRLFNSPIANTMINRKRKADEEGDPFRDRQFAQDSINGENEVNMSASPSNSPSINNRRLPRSTKRMKTNVSSRPLSLSRLLETLDTQSLRTVLRSICEAHPEIGNEVVSTAPRPTVSAALKVLEEYESAFRTSFPFGGSGTSDYDYNRVRQPLQNLLDSLSDFTPSYLPPNEPQISLSLTFLDGATDIIHRLPTWDNLAHNHHKYFAYEEISKAWAVVLKEAAKKGAGIQLQYGGWDQKLSKHNEQARGRMEAAVDELQNNLGWLSGGGHPRQEDTTSIREQLLSGSFGANMPVRVGPW